MQSCRGLLFCCAVWGISCWGLASGRLEVDESALRIDSDPIRPVLHMPVRSRDVGPVDVRIELLRDFSDDPRTTLLVASRRVEAVKGTTHLEIPLQLPRGPLLGMKERALLMSRLRYALTPAGRPDAPLQGMVALSRLVPAIFVLEVLTPPVALVGSEFGLAVRTRHPTLRTPVAGVDLLVQFPDTPGMDSQQARTDADGLAMIRMICPDVDEFEFRLEARRGDVVRSVTQWVEVQSRSESVVLSLDKPLYKPGQTVLFRALVLGRGEEVSAKTPVTFRIDGPTPPAPGARLEAVTDGHGIADGSWRIPIGAEIGNYRVEVTLPHVERFFPRWQSSFRVSRYQLPTFKLRITPDRSYYLPGQTARIRIESLTLDGQPLRDMAVKVREVQYGEEEGSEVGPGGLTNQEGLWISTIDLSARHQNFESSPWRKFRDLEYEATGTDPLTGNSVHRRFVVRVTQEPIHVYVIQNSRQPAGTRAEILISTYLADGSPIEARLRARLTNPEDNSDPPLTAGATTNRFGVARLGFFEFTTPGEWQLDVWAEDGQGRLGHVVEEVDVVRPEALLVRVKDPLPRPGDPIRVEIQTGAPGQTALLEVRDPQGRGLYAETLMVDSRSQTLEIPHRSGFEGEMRVVVTPMSEGGRYRLGSTGVFYPPAGGDLKLELATPRREMAPGQKVRLELRLSDSGGAVTDGVVAIAVVDSALEDLYRADSSAREWFFPTGQPDQDPLRGIPTGDPEEIELVARMHLFGSDRSGDLETDEPYMSGAFREVLSRQFVDLKGRLLEYLETLEGRPADGQRMPFVDYLESVAPASDPWGTPYRSTVGYDRHGISLHFTSAGVDEVPGTDDDVLAFSVSRPYLLRTMGEISNCLTRYHRRSQDSIRDAATLRRQLSGCDIDLTALRDPWGNPYRPQFRRVRANEEISLVSAGPDRRFEGDDDIRLPSYAAWRYFSQTGKKIDAALLRASLADGTPVRDDETLLGVLLSAGIGPESLQDTWGRPLHRVFDLDEGRIVVKFVSAGADGVFATESRGWNDDFTVWTASCGQALHPHRQAIRRVIEETYTELGDSLTSGQIAMRLVDAGIDLQDHLDPFGRPFIIGTERKALLVRSGHGTESAKVDAEPDTSAELVPIEQFLVHIKSLGRDGRSDTEDDVRIVTWGPGAGGTSFDFEQWAEGLPPESHLVDSYVGAVWWGEIQGVVMDQSGATIPGAEVEASHQSGVFSVVAITNDDGSFHLDRLIPGLYRVTCGMSGFRVAVLKGIPVQAERSVQFSIVLEVGDISETVTVSSSGSPGRRKTFEAPANQIPSESPQGSRRISRATPPLRRHFVETLVWNPRVVTDKEGRASLTFPLDDSLTTWKIRGLASTRDGRLAQSQEEIVSSLPFYAEFNPPPVLTQGDRIQLPVVVRNFEDRAEEVRVTFDSGDWAESVGDSARTLSVASGQSASVVFGFEAAQLTEAGAQTVEAVGRFNGDALQRRVRVRPLAQESVRAQTQLLHGPARFDVSIPAHALPEGGGLELKIYPDLASQLEDARRGMLKRPTGCGEQTISSTYPNLFILQFSDDQSLRSQNALRNLELGRDRLYGFQTHRGGFAYWQGREPSVALTAYALQLLLHMSDFVEVESRVTDRALGWLASEEASVARQGLEVRSLVSEIVGRLLKENRVGAGKVADLQSLMDVELAAGTHHSRLSYVGVNLARTVYHRGRMREAWRMGQALAAAATRENSRASWGWGAATPFGGRGKTARIVTTSRMVWFLHSLLRDARDQARRADVYHAQDLERLKDEALLYLLDQKDRYGGWYSTRATVEALEAFDAVFDASPEGVPDSFEIRVDGHPRGRVERSDVGSDGLLRWLWSTPLSRGPHTIELRPSGGGGKFVVQLLNRYYTPWEVGKGIQSGLNLQTRFSHTTASVGDPIRCDVEITGIPAGGGTRMLLVEVGLPPGSKPDRASLGRTVKGGSVSQFEILPDRVVFYLWARTDPPSFSFDFTPNLQMQAWSAPSLVYDYYDPTGSDEREPVLFQIGPRPHKAVEAPGGGPE